MVNPFYGKELLTGEQFVFDVLIDNASNLAYNKNRIFQSTYQIINNFSIVYGMPYVYDNIDDLPYDVDEDVNRLESLFYTRYNITTVK